MSIAVAYIPTPPGEAALDRALQLALQHDEQLVVLNFSRGDALVDKKWLNDQSLTGLKDRLTQSGLDYEIKHEVKDGDTAENILDAVTDLDIRTLVIGLRPRTLTGKMIFGSVAQRVLTEAPCEVLAVKGPTS